MGRTAHARSNMSIKELVGCVQSKYSIIYGDISYADQHNKPSWMAALV